MRSGQCRFVVQIHNKIGTEASIPYRDRLLDIEDVVIVTRWCSVFLGLFGWRILRGINAW